jgi:hypothetical protein
MSSLTIQWQSTSLPERGGEMGHGYCIYRSADRKRYAYLAAFVEGFGWSCGAKDAVVRFDPRRMPNTESEFAALKAAIVAPIRVGDVSASKIAPGYWGGANA